MGRTDQTDYGRGRHFVSALARAFTREGWDRGIDNLDDLLRHSGTKSIECLIAVVSLVQGLMYALPDGMMSRYHIYAIMVRAMTQPICAAINICVGSLLLFAIGQQKINTDKNIAPISDLPIPLLHEADSYFGENAMFLTVRRSVLWLAVFWNITAFISFFATAPDSSLWIWPLAFGVESVWSLWRLRCDEGEVRIKIREYRRQQQDAVVAEQAIQVFREVIHGRIALLDDEERHELGQADRVGSVGGSRRDTAT